MRAVVFLARPPDDLLAVVFLAVPDDLRAVVVFVPPDDLLAVDFFAVDFEPPDDFLAVVFFVPDDFVAVLFLAVVFLVPPDDLLAVDFFVVDVEPPDDFLAAVFFVPPDDLLAVDFFVVDVEPPDDFLAVDLVPLEAFLAVDLVPPDALFAVDLVPLEAFFAVDFAPPDAFLAVDLVPLDAFLAVDFAPLEAFFAVDFAPPDDFFADVFFAPEEDFFAVPDERLVERLGVVFEAALVAPDTTAFATSATVSIAVSATPPTVSTTPCDCCVDRLFPLAIRATPLRLRRHRRGVSESKPRCAIAVSACRARDVTESLQMNQRSAPSLLNFFPRTECIPLVNESLQLVACARHVALGHVGDRDKSVLPPAFVGRRQRRRRHGVECNLQRLRDMLRDVVVRVGIRFGHCVSVGISNNVPPRPRPMTRNHS